MDWKQFTIRLIEALRWPAVAIALLLIFREPVMRLFSMLLDSSAR